MAENQPPKAVKPAAPFYRGEFIHRATKLWEITERSWFRSVLRARTPDGDRYELKMRRNIRAQRLFFFLSQRSVA